MNDEAIGFIACLISAVFFGSMMVPVKHFDIGNGKICIPTFSCNNFSEGFLVHEDFIMAILNLFHNFRAHFRSLKLITYI